MNKYIITASNGLEYELHGDVYLPKIDFLPEEKQPLGMWAIERMNYLEAHRSGLFTRLLLGGKLWHHLLTLDEQAQARFERIIDQLAQAEGVTEQLKAADQMAWVGRMNNIRSRAEEIVRAEIVYA